MLNQPQPDTRMINLFNPLTEDFTVQYADDNNVPHPYTLHAQEIQAFPAYIANHIKKHLSQKIYNEKYAGIRTRESIMPEILKEIEVEI